MTQLLAVVGGAVIGAVSRYAVSLYAVRTWGTGFPIGTLLVNVLGSFLIGFLWAWFSESNLSPAWRIFLFVGILGSFTTFSSFSLETLHLFQEGNWKLAILNMVLQNSLGLIAAAGGFLLGRWFS